MDQSDPRGRVGHRRDAPGAARPTSGGLAVVLGIAAVVLFVAAMMLPIMVGPQGGGRLDDPALVHATLLQRWVAIGSWLGFPISVFLGLGAHSLWEKSRRSVSSNLPNKDN